MSPRVGLDTETVVNAAIEMADAKGIEAVTIATLAKKLQIRPPSLYNHITGLEELKKKVALYSLEQLYKRLETAALHKKGDEAIRAISYAYVTYVRSHPGLYAASVQLPNLKDPDIQYIGDKIVKLVLKALSDYSLTEEEAIHGVRGLRSILHGFASLEQSGNFGLPLDIDVSLKLLIETFIRGIHSLENQK
ncbi:TetR/AcrR family transcriptional regulator [Alkalihalobacterium elongatum]|uniref:TetR/AcrR family transcriptional regulator n=1 Tax=Alkalihalobacterium elongatum TaxID=2675466 RepID=UPI001C1F704D|nr:TetR-like C-terminal domain-containing protein [Alkalihalobacterium elongatum]